ncbi:MAG: hypothetical protein NC906_07710, partial [Candidatus Omnitrophica bacterium]|nr:hypothetical protein [Candidatus Omnitrophota bacterium]
MPVFSYEGFDKKGRRISGKIEAENDVSARLAIKNSGVYIKKLQQVENKRYRLRERIRKENFA